MNQGWNARCVSVHRALNSLAPVGEKSCAEMIEIECEA